MEFAIVLAATLGACLLLRTPLHRHPTAFYVLAIAIDVLFVFGSTVGLPRPVWAALFVLVQKCELSLALFTIVMYIGALSPTSKLYQWLKPIRSELSIIAWFLALGHMAVYLLAYIPKTFQGAHVDTNVLGGFVLAMILLVLLMALGITSFAGVKRHMRTDDWKRLQKLAYPFFMLIYVHVLLLLLPAALHGGLSASVTVAVYSVVFIGYAVARTARALREHAQYERSVKSTAESDEWERVNA